MTRPKVPPTPELPTLLDLFHGEGGAAEGYRRAGYRVIGVDNDPARLALSPFETIEADALVFLADHGHEFDAIHASPPCTGYSRGTAALPDRLDRYDRLIPAVRDLLRATGTPYVIENVEDAGPELVMPITLCWTAFYDYGSVVDHDGTPLWMRRHRLFESNVSLMSPGCFHPRAKASGWRTQRQCAGAYGGARRDKDEARFVRKGGYVPDPVIMRQLLGTPWMSEKGCMLCIPPVYSEFVGSQLLGALA